MRDRENEKPWRREERMMRFVMCVSVGSRTKKNVEREREKP